MSKCISRLRALPPLDLKQKDVAEILGVTKGALSQRLNMILRKIRNMYMEG